MQKTKSLVFFFVLLASAIFIAVLLAKSTDIKNFLTKKIKDKSVSSVSYTYKPKEFVVNGKKKVKYQEDYTLLLLGDSMTEALGNSDELRANLAKNYPRNSFEVLNYGFGSTNILSVQQRLEGDTFHGRVFRPITEIEFDLILIESFGHNPLSELPLPEGLQKQTEALDNIVKTIRDNNNHAKIVFVATIAPSKKHYAEKINNLTPEVRQKWAEERIAYIKNHMEYAKSHNIPVIDVFSKSLGSDGDLNLDYVSKDDYIHPSPKGIYLISNEIGKFIFENHIL
ncbi:MAG: SGNH/GDSL hydrolase family protein [Candidatus Daviesbacteria bacterium]|nr:SGNH/GDSL hydrolase family protein [Candidatus Daviesbacteria bacterium]